jgi:hypothetical protein
VIDDQGSAQDLLLPDPFDEPLPLSRWVRGTATLLFRDRAELALEMTQSEAGELSEIVSGRREGSVRHWSDLRWVTFAEDRIEAITFEPLPDMGWPLTAEARERQRIAGHPNGVLRTLHRYWAAREEPLFSGTALLALSAVAEHKSPEHVCRISTMLKGQDGARRAAAVWRAADRLEREATGSHGETSMREDAADGAPRADEHDNGPEAPSKPHAGQDQDAPPMPRSDSDDAGPGEDGL